jgi:hypothetical protein
MIPSFPEVERCPPLLRLAGACHRSNDIVRTLDGRPTDDFSGRWIP